MAKYRSLVDMFFQGKKYKVGEVVEMDDDQGHVHLAVKMVEKFVEPPKPEPPKVEVKPEPTPEPKPEVKA